jgi:hypothetical protein
MITCFIDGFTSELKTQSIFYLLSESEHIHIGFWTLKLTYNQYDFYDQDDLQEWNTKVFFFKIGQRGHRFSSGIKKSFVIPPAGSGPCLFA